MYIFSERFFRATCFLDRLKHIIILSTFGKYSSSLLANLKYWPWAQQSDLARDEPSYLCKTEELNEVIKVETELG